MGAKDKSPCLADDNELQEVPQISGQCRCQRRQPYYAGFNGNDLKFGISEYGEFDLKKWV